MDWNGNKSPWSTLLIPFNTPDERPGLHTMVHDAFFVVRERGRWLEAGVMNVDSCTDKVQVTRAASELQTLTISHQVVTIGQILLL